MPFLGLLRHLIKGQKISNFSLKDVNYGDPKHKFDFPICHTDSLRQSLWNELDVLEVENPASPRASDGVQQRAKDIKRKRGGNAKTPYLGFSELDSEKLSSEQLATKANRERNFAYAPVDFKLWYQRIILFMGYVPQNSNTLGWLVQDEYIYPNSVAPVAPLKLW